MPFLIQLLNYKKYWSASLIEILFLMYGFKRCFFKVLLTGPNEGERWSMSWLSFWVRIIESNESFRRRSLFVLSYITVNRLLLEFVFRFWLVSVVGSGVTFSFSKGKLNFFCFQGGVLSTLGCLLILRGLLFWVISFMKSLWAMVTLNFSSPSS